MGAADGTRHAVGAGLWRPRRPPPVISVPGIDRRFVIVPDFVHVLYNGQIVKSGTKELAYELEERGYDWIKEEHANA